MVASSCGNLSCVRALLAAVASANLTCRIQGREVTALDLLDYSGVKSAQVRDIARAFNLKTAKEEAAHIPYDQWRSGLSGVTAHIPHVRMCDPWRSGIAGVTAHILWITPSVFRIHSYLPNHLTTLSIWKTRLGHPLQCVRWNLDSIRSRREEQNTPGA